MSGISCSSNPALIRNDTLYYSVADQDKRHLIDVGDIQFCLDGLVKCNLSLSCWFDVRSDAMRQTRSKPDPRSFNVTLSVIRLPHSPRRAFVLRQRATRDDIVADSCCRGIIEMMSILIAVSFSLYIYGSCSVFDMDRILLMV